MFFINLGTYLGAQTSIPIFKTHWIHTTALHTECKNGIYLKYVSTYPTTIKALQQDIYVPDVQYDD